MAEGRACIYPIQVVLSYKVVLKRYIWFCCLKIVGRTHGPLVQCFLTFHKLLSYNNSLLCVSVMESMIC
jgi:hypothetical protein